MVQFQTKENREKFCLHKFFCTIAGDGPSVADPGCLSRIRIFSIPNPNFSIPDLNFFHPGSASASKNLSILTQKWFLSSQKYDPCCSSRIRIPDPDPDYLPITDPGVKKAPDPRSRIRIRNIGRSPTDLTGPETIFFFLVIKSY
jgi:hypothetical protein